MIFWVRSSPTGVFEPMKTIILGFYELSFIRFLHMVHTLAIFGIVTGFCFWVNLYVICSLE
eukprot:UN27111